MGYTERWVEAGDATLFLRARTVSPSHGTILFLHGLGETSACFAEAFASHHLKEFTLLAPDWPGFGRSRLRTRGSYSFAAQLRRLSQLLDREQVHELFLAGHSMGADLATLACEHASLKGRILALVNIEGTLSSDDRSISGRAIARDDGGTFDSWFPSGFLDELLGGSPNPRASLLRYGDAVRLCEPAAFLESSHEIRAHAPDGATVMTRILAALDIPAVALYAPGSMSALGRRLLGEHAIESRAFPDSAHWLMIDESDAAYATISGFFRGHSDRRTGSG